MIPISDPADVRDATGILRAPGPLCGDGLAMDEARTPESGEPAIIDVSNLTRHAVLDHLATLGRETRTTIRCARGHPARRLSRR
ncbi:MAG TPA: hypothetical protein VMF62_06235 [Acetobacteraceae bacterium]|jgi:hypothetical protein|nr:hypothetical protein [Acetobacteraceae bacterium]